MLDRAALERLIESGEIDTVILGFPDQQGRLMGKRLTGSHFREHAATEGTHACDYLLTVDMEMEPQPGYELANWERGYGDFHIVPDWSTTRRLPWLAGTALILGDPHHADGRPVEQAPRAILRRQVERAAALGFHAQLGSELECFLFRDPYPTDGSYRNLRPFSAYLEDYHLFQGSREEPILRTIRNQMGGAGIAVEGTKGEFGRGQVEINLRYGDPLAMADAHTIFKQGAKEIADAQGCAITFMAKPNAAEAGSSCHIHMSLWDGSGDHNVFWDPAAGSGHSGHGERGGPSELFGHFLGGQIALARALSLFYAPTVNSYKRYQSRSWAPTAIAWARDNRTCGFRVVGEGRSFRVENRIPGADTNPYLAFAAMIAAGLHGVERRLPLPPERSGDLYAARDIPGPPTSLREAITLWEECAELRELFGAAVADHYLLTARHEQAAFDRAVTDWELARYFERI